VKIAGLENFYVLTDEQNNKGLIIALYGNQEDAENENLFKNCELF
jgi:hypothetical protein